MLEHINEPIRVTVVFDGQRVTPQSFLWRGRVYDKLKVNLAHRAGVGEDKIYYFSVTDETNFFRLAFSTRDLSWRLEEVYFDG